VILAISVSEGATVPVGAPIAVIGQAGEGLSHATFEDAGAGTNASAVARAPAGAAPSPSAKPAATVPTTTAAAATSATSSRPKASPLARRIAARRGVDLAALSGSGPDGRVIRVDVERALATGNGAGTVTAAAPAVTDQAPATAQPSKGEPQRHELTRLQQTVARRMAQSRATVPDIELRSEVDMGEAVALRERLREVADPAPSINDFMIKAAALALREFPRVNGSYTAPTEIETYERVNVGFAVAADDALVVPTIFDADRKSLGEIGATARELAAAVRDGTIAPAQLDGGTFTVSNLGMYGVDSFSAVINPPQAAILAVGSLKRRPVVSEFGELLARPTVVLTLACDHRILYGVDGARFLQRVRELLERPHALLL
jgi:pyruvate dehydrogenase E2 component (dihydrolipoamide acetyltransferase)